MRTVTFIETDRVALPGAKGAERGMRGCLIGAEFQVGKRRKFWRWMAVVEAPRCEYTQCH